MQDLMEVRGTLPYPPSINNYWRSGVKKSRSTGKVCKTIGKTEKCLLYMREVYWMMKQQKIEQLIGTSFRLELYIYPPDKRRRDIDNLCKGAIDSLQFSEVIVDDFYIDELYVKRCDERVGGEVEFILMRLI